MQTDGAETFSRTERSLQGYAILPPLHFQINHLPVNRRAASLWPPADLALGIPQMSRRGHGAERSGGRPVLLGEVVVDLVDDLRFRHQVEKLHRLGNRAWTLFTKWLGGQPWWGHVEWLLQKQFKTPDEWLGEEGAKFRRKCGMREIPAKTIKHWQAFFAKHEGKSLSDIEALLSKEAAA